MKSFFLFSLISFCCVCAEVSSRYNDALELYKQSQFQESILLLREIIQEEGKSFEVHYLAGHNYWKIGNREVALQHFTAAYQKDNSKVEIYLDLVKLLFQMKKYETAKTYSQDGISKFKENVDLKLEHASVLVALNEHQSALLIVEDLKNSNSKDHRPFSLEAKIYFDLKQYEKAELSLKWALEISSKNKAGVKNNLALVYEKLSRDKYKDYKKFQQAGDTKKALQYFNEARSYIEQSEGLIKDAIQELPNNTDFQENNNKIQKFKAKIDAVTVS
jgi:tetratricopeptide (TPR) repeat protein